MLAPDQWSAAAFRFPSNCTFSLRKGFSTDLPGSVEVECNLEAGWEWRGDLQNFTPLMWKIGLSVDPFFQGCAQSPHSQLRKPIIPVEDGYEKELMSFLVVERRICRARSICRRLHNPQIKCIVQFRVERSHAGFAPVYRLFTAAIREHPALSPQQQRAAVHTAVHRREYQNLFALSLFFSQQLIGFNPSKWHTNIPI